MGLASSARYNSAVTNASYHLRAATKIRLIPEQVEAYEQAQAEGRYAVRPNYEVIGTCGHRIEVLSPSRVTPWLAAQEAGKPKKRRCIYCPKGIEA